MIKTKKAIIFLFVGIMLTLAYTIQIFYGIPSFWLLLVNFSVLLACLIYCIVIGNKTIIGVSIALTTMLMISVPILIMIVLSQPSGPDYNYYSEDIYHTELFEQTGFQLSKNSKIIAKTDSIYAKSMGDYEHQLYCVLDLSGRDQRELIKKLKKVNAEVRDTLSKDEFHANFFMVPENNPLKGLKSTSFRKTYYWTSQKDFQDSYFISFHKNGKTVLFMVRHS